MRVNKHDDVDISCFVVKKFTDASYFFVSEHISVSKQLRRMLGKQMVSILVYRLLIVFS